MTLRRSLLIGLSAVAISGYSASGPNWSNGPSDKASGVSVECSRSSGLIQFSITNHRKIGKVRITVRDVNGKVTYIEEGKALTGELVRRLDKGMFPKGAATVVVESRDLHVVQAFTIQ